MRAVYVVPALLFAGLAFILINALSAPSQEDAASMLIGKPVPSRVLPPLDAQTQGIAPTDFIGHVTVLNVFASWCAPCRAEAPLLAKLKGVVLYGIVYKDEPEKARAFLNELGNPFSRIGIDEDGEAGAAWGVAGVPETFVIDAQGIVRQRIAGELDEEDLADEILPAIQRAKAAQ